MIGEGELDWVLIAGAARSGTTLVREMVSLHPQTAIFHEYGLMRLRQALDLITSDSMAGIGTDDVDYRFELGRCSPLQLSANSVARAIFESVFDKHDLRVVGDKMPLGSGWDIFDPAIERFAGIRYVLLLREPAAVLRSSLRRRDLTAQGLDSWPVSTVAEACAEFAHAWLSMQRITLAHPDRVLVLKFEDLCSDPAESLRIIFDFLGLPPAPLASLPDRPPPHERASAPTEEERAFIARFLQPLTLNWQSTDARDLLLLQDLPMLWPFDQAISLAHPRADTILVSGFSGLEPWLRWTEGRRAHLRLRHEPSVSGIVIDLEVAAAHAIPEIGCLVDILLNGKCLGTSAFTNGPARHGFYLAPDAMRQDGIVDIEFRVHTPSEPMPGGDMRALGLAIVALTLQPAI